MDNSDPQGQQGLPSEVISLTREQLDSLLSQHITELRLEEQARAQAQAQAQAQAHAEILAQMQAQIDSLSRPAPTPEAAGTSSSEKAAATTQPGQVRPDFKSIPSFDGDASLLASWLLTLRTVLSTKREFIGDDRDCWVWIWSKLGDKVKRRLAAFFENGGTNGDFDPNDLLEYVHTCYHDPHQRKRALRALTTVNQGAKETFTAFLNTFEVNLMRAGGMRWDDEIKLNYLRPRLSIRLQEAASIATVSDRDYSAAVDSYRRIAHGLETLSHDSGRGGILSHPNRQGGSSGRDADGDSAMTGVNATSSRNASSSATNRSSNRTNNRRRAPWVTPEVRQQRKDANQCIRCGSSEHFVAGCMQLPAQPPQTSVNVASTSGDTTDATSGSENA